jgi:hypothetical protein
MKKLLVPLMILTVLFNAAAGGGGQQSRGGSAGGSAQVTPIPYPVNPSPPGQFVKDQEILPGSGDRVPGPAQVFGAGVCHRSG